MEGPLRGCLAGGVEMGRRLFLDDCHLHHRLYLARSREVLKTRSL